MRDVDSAREVDRYEQAAADMQTFCESMTGVRALQVAAEIGLADLVGDHPVAVAELAAALDVETDVLRMVLLVLTAYGYLDTTGDDRFTLTEAGGPLRSDHPRSMRAVVRTYGMLHAEIGAMGHTLATGEDTFQLLRGKPLFQYLREDPERGAIFATGMAERSRLHTSVIRAAYDFSGHSHIVDVGGGDGTFLASVLTTVNGDVRGTVFDQPQLLPAQARTRESFGLGERLQAVGGDFFAEVPAGGSLYVLKAVIHDWPDDQAVEILSRCREAMSGNGKLVLFEWVVFPGGNEVPSVETSLMLRVTVGGGERTRQDFDEILSRSGFRLDRVLPMTGGLCAVEASPV